MLDTGMSRTQQERREFWRQLLAQHEQSFSVSVRPIQVQTRAICQRAGVSKETFELPLRLIQARISSSDVDAGLASHGPLRVQLPHLVYV